MKFVILFPTFVFFAACNAMAASFFFLKQGQYPQHFFCTFVALLLCWYIVKFFVQYAANDKARKFRDEKFLFWLAQRQLTTGSRKNMDESQTYWPDGQTPEQRLEDLRTFIAWCMKLQDYKLRGLLQMPDKPRAGAPSNGPYPKSCICGLLAFCPGDTSPHGVCIRRGG